MAYFNKKIVEDVDVDGKRVLLRCDFNVPLDENGEVTNTRRIDESLRTIKYLLLHGAKVILCSHMGRPSGVIDPKLSLKPVANDLSKKLGSEVKLADDVVGSSARALCSNLKNGEAVLLENLRFRIEEQDNEESFAKELASLADIFVNDAFGTAHRKHASTYGVTRFLPSVGGYLMQKEIETMCSILENPKRPFVSILGGAKVSDKFNVINRLLEKVDVLVVGGGMAYTFMNAMGYSVGTSICEYDKADMAKDLMVKARDRGVKLVMPMDNIVGLSYSPDTEFKLVSSDSIPDGWTGMDIGPKTEKLFADAIEGAGTVVWNGPMGVSEWENFASGTCAVARAIAQSGAVSIIGGGDSAASVDKLGFADRMTHISTGGGASLRLLEGAELPGIEGLNDK